MGRSDDERERFERAREAADAARRRYEDHDTYTFQHSVRVARWAVLLARQIPGFPPARLRALEVTALLHDFGKTFLDPALLRREGPLSEDDWVQIRRHPVLGADQAPVPREFLVPEGIRWHHKHFDGGGYPDGPLKGVEIPLEARLIAVADVFDALTSPRPYRAESIVFTPARALETMRARAGHELDPGLVTHFERLYDEECQRVGGEAGQRTMQVQSVLGIEVGRARDLLRVEIGPFDPADPLKGRRPDDRLLDRLVAGLVRGGLDPRSARNVARHVLRLAPEESVSPGDLLEPPRPIPQAAGGPGHHLEVTLRLRRPPPDADYMHVVVFLGQLWVSVGESRSDAFEMRLAR